MLFKYAIILTLIFLGSAASYSHPLPFYCYSKGHICSIYKCSSFKREQVREEKEALIKKEKEKQVKREQYEKKQQELVLKAISGQQQIHPSSTISVQDIPLEILSLVAKYTVENTNN